MKINHILITTEYAELLALDFYSQINNLDFLKIAKNRSPKKLDVFPDFVIDNNLYLEVTRSLDEVSGKQNNDTATVFDSDDKGNTVCCINERNKEYERNGNNHDISFSLYHGIAVAELPIVSDERILSNILESIVKKEFSAKPKKPSGVLLDLFVVNYHELSLELEEQIIASVKLNGCLNKIYITYLRDSSIFVLELKNDHHSVYKISECRSKEELINLLFKLGWIKGEKYK